MDSKEEVKGVHKKLYRIYYTTYDDNAHARVLELLKSRYGVTPREEKSVVVPEFRFIELPIEQDGLSEEIKALVSEVVRSQYVKVDRIDTSR